MSCWRHLSLLHQTASRDNVEPSRHTVAYAEGELSATAVGLPNFLLNGIRGYCLRNDARVRKPSKRVIQQDRLQVARSLTPFKEPPAVDVPYFVTIYRMQAPQTLFFVQDSGLGQQKSAVTAAGNSVARRQQPGITTFPKSFSAYNPSLKTRPGVLLCQEENVAQRSGFSSPEIHNL